MIPTSYQEERNTVRALLAKHQLSHVWLLAQLEKRGISIPDDVLSRYLNGTRKNDKAAEVVGVCRQIILEYEKAMQIVQRRDDLNEAR